ncbi:MAG: PDZ domain-containing protein [Bacteroidetes bacterium]|jgi:carboxyl-terminal processing protease|nr:PDZ domain-containing protein [Bacteroidota bacterium]
MKYAARITGILLLSAILFITAASVNTGDLFFEIKRQLTIFGDVYKTVATQYVDEVGPEPLMQEGIDAMLERLDPYTVFIDEGEQRQMEIFSSGSYGGIGIDAGYRGDQVVIIAPLEGYPAHRAGLRPGDIILQINGSDIEGLTPEEVQQLTIGDIGTEVTLGIRRPGLDRMLEFTLERENIELKNVQHATKIGEKSQIGYVKLTRFGQGAAEEVRNAILDMGGERELEGLVLDLRNNPGGLLGEAVNIVDKFIEPGVTVVETRGRLESHNSTLVSEEPALFEEMPIVVLLNNGSASASEVVAGALQDLDRAVVVGETSFGKGLVQTVQPLSYNTSIKVTVSKYYTPSGRSIQSVEYLHTDSLNNREVPESRRRAFRTKNGRIVYDGRGIEPDISLTDEESSLLDLALQQNNRYFFFVNDLISSSQSQYSAMPEDLFDQFAAFLIEGDFTFETPADGYLQQLNDQINSFSDQDEASEKIGELQQLLGEYKREQIFENRDLLTKRLEREWINQTMGEDQKVNQLLTLDEMVNESIELLQNPYRYRTELRP